MIKKALILTLALSSTEVFCGPSQLEILGLVPGVADPGQVQLVSMEPTGLPSENVRLEIGGHAMPCVVSFIDGRLADLTCFTGQGARRHEIYTEASNTQVHADLVAGFAKKFGKPDSVLNEAVRTRLGVQYTKNLIIWIDKKGNRLRLASISGTVGEGLLYFESLASRTKTDLEAAEKERNRKF